MEISMTALKIISSRTAMWSSHAHQWMIKKNVAYAYSGVLFIHKEQNYVI
jgi:hypothetical protein